MSSYEIAADLNRARVAVERLHAGFQQVVHQELSPIGPAEARAILERIKGLPVASEEQRKEAADLLAALNKSFRRKAAMRTWLVVHRLAGHHHQT
jgi:hypothetical protein